MSHDPVKTRITSVAAGCLDEKNEANLSYQQQIGEMLGKQVVCHSCFSMRLQDSISFGDTFEINFHLVSLLSSSVLRSFHQPKWLVK